MTKRKISLKTLNKLHAKRLANAAAFRKEAAGLPKGFQRNVAMAACRWAVWVARETRLHRG